MMENPKSKVQADADARLLQSNTFQKHIEATQRELKEQLNDHQRYIKTVENELAHLQLQLKLNVGPRKMASEFLRGKIEAQNEVLAGVRRRHAEAKKALADCEAELQAEEQEKERLCSELNLLVAESTAAQLAKLEELKNHLDMLSRWSSRMGHNTSSAEADAACQQAHAFATGAGLQVPGPPGTHAHMPSCSQNPQPTTQSEPTTHSHQNPNGPAEVQNHSHLAPHHTDTTAQPSSSQPAAAPSVGAAPSTSTQRAASSSIPNSRAGAGSVSSRVTAASQHCKTGVSTPPSASSHLNSSRAQGVADIAELGVQGGGVTDSAGLGEGSPTQAPRAPRRGNGRKPLSASRIPLSSVSVAAGGSANNTMYDAAASPSATIQAHQPRSTGSTEAVVARVLHHGAPFATEKSTQEHATSTEQHAECMPRRSNFAIVGGAQQESAPQPHFKAEQPIAANVSKGQGGFSGFDV